MVHFNRTVSRALALALSVVMVMTLMLAPVGAEKAEGISAELKFSLEGLDASVKLFVDPVDPVVGLLAELSMEGQTLADAALYMNAESLVLDSTTLLPQAIGIDLAAASENLPNSVFAPNSGSMFALEELDYIALQGFFAGREAGAAQVTASTPSFTQEQLEQLEDVGAKYVELIPSLLMDNAGMAMSPETVEVGSQKIATSRMTLSLSNEALTNIITSLLTAVAEDAELQQAAVWVMEAGLANMPEETTAQLEGMSAADLTAQLWAVLPELAQEAAANLQASGLGCSVSVNTSKDSGNVIRVSAELGDGEDSMSIVYTMGESLAESEEISLKLLFDGEEELAFVYQLEENTDAHYAASVTVREAGDVTAVMSMDADKANSTYTVVQALSDGTYNVFAAKLTQTLDGSLKAEFGADLETPYDEEHYLFSFLWDNTLSRYTLTASIDGEVSSLSGTVSVGDDIVITVDQVDGEAAEGMSLTLHGSDSVDVPAFAELLTMNEEQVAEQLSTVIAFLQSFGLAA